MLGSSCLSQREPVHRAGPAHVLFMSYSLPAILPSSPSTVDVTDVHCLLPAFHQRHQCYVYISEEEISSTAEVSKNCLLCWQSSLISFLRSAFRFCLLLFKLRGMSNVKHCSSHKCCYPAKLKKSLRSDFLYSSKVRQAEIFHLSFTSYFI